MATKDRHHTEYHLLLEIYLDGKTLYLSDGYRQVGDYYYEGLVIDWGSLDVDQRAMSGISSIGDYRITLANQRMQFMSTDTKFSDLFDDYYFDNREVTVRQWFEGDNYSSTTIIFNGKMTIDEFDSETVKIVVSSDFTNLERDIPFTIITAEEYPAAPSSNVNKPIPIAFGYLAKTNYGGALEYCPLYYQSAAPLILTNINERRLHIACHMIGSVWTTIEAYLPQLGVYMITSPITSTKLDDESYIDVDTDAVSVVYIPCRIVHPTRSAVTDIEELVDDNIKNYITLDGDGFNNSISIKVGNIGENFSFAQTQSTDLAFAIRYGYTTGGTGTCATVLYRNDDYDNGVGGNGTSDNIAALSSSIGTHLYNFATDKTAHGVADDQSDQYSAWRLSELGNIYCEITAAAGYTLRIYWISLYIKRIGLNLITPDTPTTHRREGLDTRKGLDRGRTRVPKIFRPLANRRYVCKVTGAQFGDWIDESGRTNGYNSGDLIQNPAYIVEWLLRYIGLHSDDINVASFDDIGNTTDGYLKDWEFAGVITDVSQAQQVINDILLQSKSRLFKDSNDKWKIATYRSDASATYTDYKFDKDNNITNLTIKKTTELYNTIRINYFYDYGAEDFRKQSYVKCDKIYSGSKLDGAITSSQTTITVDDNSDFAQFDVLLVDNEIMVCESIILPGNDINVTRGMWGSTAMAHDDNAPIYILRTDSSPDVGLVLWLPLNEFLGTEVADKSGNYNNGTISGASWATSKSGMGGCLSFSDGDYVEIPDDNTLDIEDAITLEVWVYLDSDPNVDANNNYRHIVSKAGLSVWSLVIEQDRTVNGSVYIGGARQSTLTTDKINIGEWTHLVYTFDGSTGVGKIYINGSLSKESTGTSGSIDTNNYPVKLSMVQNGYSWPGKIDEVKIYNRVLTDTEVSDHYTLFPVWQEIKAIQAAWKYEINQDLSLDANWINDDDTAARLRNFLIKFYSEPRYIVEFDTMLMASDLEIGDVFEFDDSVMDDYLKLGGESWSGKKFECLAINRTGVMDFHVIGIEVK